MPKDFEDEDGFEDGEAFEVAAAFGGDFWLVLEELPFEPTDLEIVEVLDAFTGKIAERDELDDEDLVEDGFILGGALKQKINLYF